MGRQRGPLPKHLQQTATATKSAAPHSEDEEDIFVEDFDQDFDLTGKNASKKAIGRSAKYRYTSSHDSSRKPSASSLKASALVPSNLNMREHFIRTCCKFFVLPNVRCEAEEANPDLIVNWDAIEYLQVQCTEEPVCPICLGPPLAAKMTRCGHIYCWCVLCLL